jgi:hypothetical protein
MALMRSGKSNGSVALPDIDLSVAELQAIRNEERHRALVWQKREIDVESIGSCSLGAAEAAAGIGSAVVTSVSLAFYAIAAVSYLASGN